MFPLKKGDALWQDDKSASHCNICACKFRGKLFKSGKHHCRKCGAIICADCSNYKYKSHRICSNCNRLLNESQPAKEEMNASQNILQSQTAHIVDNGLETVSSSIESSSTNINQTKEHNFSSAAETLSPRMVPPPPKRRKPKPPPPPKTHIAERKAPDEKVHKSKKHKKDSRRHRRSKKNQIEDISTEVFMKLLLMIDVENNEKREKRRKNKRKRQKRKINDNENSMISITEETKQSECTYECSNDINDDNEFEGELKQNHVNVNVPDMKRNDDSGSNKSEKMRINKAKASVGEIKQAVQQIPQERKLAIAKPKKGEKQKQSLRCGDSLAKYSNKWKYLNANTFDIRPKGYYCKKKKKGKKVPSQPAMYEVCAVDAYKMKQKMKFMDVMKKYKMDIHELIDPKQSFNLPQLVVINIMMPSNSNGIQLTLYAKLSDECRQILKRNESSAAMDLFVKFMNVCDGNKPLQKNDIRNDFKVTMRANNLSETKLPFLMKKLMKKANGQSVAIEEKAAYYSDPNGQFFIVDIDGHGMSKQVVSMWNKVQMCLDAMDIDVAFKVCASDAQCLPEQVLLCTQINKISVNDMIFISEKSATNP